MAGPRQTEPRGRESTRDISHHPDIKNLESAEAKAASLLRIVETGRLEIKKAKELKTKAKKFISDAKIIRDGYGDVDINSADIDSHVRERMKFYRDQIALLVDSVEELHQQNIGIAAELSDVAAEVHAQTQPRVEVAPSLQTDSDDDEDTRGKSDEKSKPSNKRDRRRAKAAGLPPADVAPPLEEKLPQPQSRERREPPAPGTKIYLRPKKGATHGQEVEFIRTEGETDKDFVIKFSPEGKEVVLSRNLFYPKPPEDSEVHSDFPGSKYYVETLRPQKVEFEPGNTVYFEVGTSTGKYREAKIERIDKAGALLWFGKSVWKNNSSERVLSKTRLRSGELFPTRPTAGEVEPFVEEPFAKGQPVFIKPSPGGRAYQEVIYEGLSTLHPNEIGYWEGNETEARQDTPRTIGRTEVVATVPDVDQDKIISKLKRSRYPNTLELKPVAPVEIIEEESPKSQFENLEAGDIVMYRPEKRTEEEKVSIAKITKGEDGKIISIILGIPDTNRTYPIMTKESSMKRIRIPEDTEARIIKRKFDADPANFLGSRKPEKNEDDLELDFDQEPKENDQFILWYSGKPDPSGLREPTKERLVTIKNVGERAGHIQVVFEDTGVFKFIPVKEWNACKKERKGAPTAPEADREEKFEHEPKDEAFYHVSQDNGSQFFFKIFVSEQFGEIQCYFPQFGNGRTYTRENWNRWMKSAGVEFRPAEPTDFVLGTGKKFTFGGKDFVVGKEYHCSSFPDEVVRIHEFVMGPDTEKIIIDRGSGLLEDITDPKLLSEITSRDTAALPNPYEGFDGDPAVGKQYTLDQRTTGGIFEIIEIIETKPENAGKIEFKSILSGKELKPVSKDKWNNLMKSLRPTIGQDGRDLTVLEARTNVDNTPDSDTEKTKEHEKEKPKEKKEISMQDIFEMVDKGSLQEIITGCTQLAFEKNPAIHKAIEAELAGKIKTLFDHLSDESKAQLDWKDTKQKQFLNAMKTSVALEINQLQQLDPELRRFNKEQQARKEFASASQSTLATFIKKHAGTILLPGLVAVGAAGATAMVAPLAAAAFAAGTAATIVRRQYQREQAQQEKGQESTGIFGTLKRGWRKIFAPDKNVVEAEQSQRDEKELLMRGLEQRILEQFNTGKIENFSAAVLQVLMREKNIGDNPVQLHEAAFDIQIKNQDKKHGDHGHAEHSGHGDAHGAGEHHEHFTEEELLGNPPKPEAPESKELLALKADRALFHLRQKNPATRSYTDDMRAATNKSPFFTGMWKKITAVTGSKWGLHSESTTKYVAGTIVAGAVNGGLAMLVASAGPGHWLYKAAVRGGIAFGAKGTEAAILTHGDIHREKEQALNEAYLLLQKQEHLTEDDLRKAASLIKRSGADMDIGDLLKESTKRGFKTGAKAAGVAAGAGMLFDSASSWAHGSATPDTDHSDNIQPTPEHATTQAPEPTPEHAPIMVPPVEQAPHPGSEYTVAHPDKTFHIPETPQFDSKGNMLLGTTELGKNQGAFWGALDRGGNVYNNFGMSDSEFRHWLTDELKLHGFVHTPDGWATPMMGHPSLKVEFYADSQGHPHVNFVGQEGKDFYAYDQARVLKPETTIFQAPESHTSTINHNDEIVQAKEEIYRPLAVPAETNVHMETVTKLPEGYEYGHIQHTDSGDAYLARDNGKSYVYFEQTNGTILRTSYKDFFAALPDNTNHAIVSNDRATTAFVPEHLPSHAAPPTKEYTVVNPYEKKWVDTGIPVDNVKAHVLPESDFKPAPHVDAPVSPHPDVPSPHSETPSTWEHPPKIENAGQMKEVLEHVKTAGPGAEDLKERWLSNLKSENPNQPMDIHNLEISEERLMFEHVDKDHPFVVSDPPSHGIKMFQDGKEYYFRDDELLFDKSDHGPVIIYQDGAGNPVKCDLKGFTLTDDGNVNYKVMLNGELNTITPRLEKPTGV